MLLPAMLYFSIISFKLIFNQAELTRGYMGY